MEELSEEDKRALRGSKFAPLPPQPPPSSSRLAHPGGPLKTNKAAALAKFLERKLQQDPHGLSSMNPDLLELAVRNAKATVCSGGASGSGATIRHVDVFDDPEASSNGEEAENSESKKPKKNKKQQKKAKKMKKKKKRQKSVEDYECKIGKNRKVLKL